MFQRTYTFTREDLKNQAMKKATTTTSGTKVQSRDVEVIAAVLKKIQK